MSGLDISVGSGDLGLKIDVKMVFLARDPGTQGRLRRNTYSVSVVDLGNFGSTCWISSTDFVVCGFALWNIISQKK